MRFNQLLRVGGLSMSRLSLLSLLLVLGLGLPASAVDFGAANVTLLSDNNVVTGNTAARMVDESQQSVGFNLVIDPSNSGDWRLASNGDTLKQAEGVLLAVPNTLTIPQGNARPRAFVEVPGDVLSPNAFTTGSWMSMTDISGGGSEANFGVSLAYFPFADGWTAGHVDSSGAVLAGNSDDVTVTQTLTGRFSLQIDGVNPATDGILFTIGAENSNSGNYVPNAILADGSGWDIRVNDQGANFAAAGEANADFSFVFVPFDANNLVAGHIDDGAPNGNGGTISGVGNFTVTALATPGEYLLTGPGLDPTQGALLVGVTDLVTSAGITAPEDNFLVHEFNPGLGGYVIKSLDLDGAADQVVEWTFAFVPFEEGLSLRVIPEPTTLLLGVMGLGALCTRRRVAPERQS